MKLRLPGQREREAQRLLDQLVEFCWRRGGKCYGKWPVQRIRQYLLFHMRQGTFVFLRTFGIQDICGTAVAWQCQEAPLRVRLARGWHGFEWKGNDPRGDCVFVADVVATRPGALRVLIGTLVDRFPQWRSLKILTMRKGKLVEYRQRIVKLITRREGD